MAVVATGFFDGVHLGHQRVINTLLSAARERGEQSAVITFWPHPRTVLQDDARTFRLLTPLLEKKDSLTAMGVDRVEVLDFSRGFSRLTAERYLREWIIDRYGGTAIVLGYDNRMGSDGLSHDEIVSLAESLGLTVLEVPAISAGPDSTISSTRIRKALEAGDVKAAEAMLGRRYSLHGVVVGGNRKGRTIGFPTANVQLYEPLKLVPANGVYLVEVDTLGSSHTGMANIGVRPTVGGSSRVIEVHIFDFDEQIYGLDIRLRLVDRLRGERRFDSLEELGHQLAADREECRRLLRPGD